MTTSTEAMTEMQTIATIKYIHMLQYTDM